MSILIKDMEMPKSCKSCDLLQDYDGDMYCPLNDYLNFGDIENVPDYVMIGCPLSAQPDVTGINVGDMVSRQAAIDALDEQIEQCNKALGSFDISPKDEYAIKVERASLEAYKEQLENMPSAQPEIIRCKDCKYWREHKYAKETKRYIIPFCGFNAIYTEADDYCSKAEKRRGGDNT